MVYPKFPSRSLLETSINAQTTNYLTEEQLANFIVNRVFPDEYIVQIFNLFTDVPVAAIARFQLRHGINDLELRLYYETYVKEVYPNVELEDMLYVGNSL